VAEPDPKGFLVVGANPVARAVASAIEARGFRAMLTDTYWDNVVKARMEGLSVYFGNPVSEHADRHLDLVGIGRLLGLTPHEDQNALAATHYRFEFGPEAVFTLPAAKNGDKSPKMHPSSRRTGRRLFGKDVTYAKMASLLAGGAEIRATKLTESFTLDKFTSLHGGRAICLFAIDPKQRIHVFTVGGAPEPVEGWTLLSLLPADPKGAQGTPDRADRKKGP
jgi:CPA1 family monovalent cation:H+ antiporter